MLSQGTLASFAGAPPPITRMLALIAEGSEVVASNSGAA
jgi:hypothetical protein